MHSSNDLQILTQEVRKHVGGDTNALIDDMMSNFKDQDVLR